MPDVFGKSLSVTDTNKAVVTEFLKKHFSEGSSLNDCGVVSSIYSMSGGGQHDTNHYIALTDLGLRFGLKSPNPPQSREMEKLMGDLAELLEAPNACHVVQTDIIDFIPAFKGRLVNVTRWLPNGLRLNSDFTGLQKDLANDPDLMGKFCSQFGEWMAFGILLGVDDRKVEHFVWAKETSLLAMIDMEMALREIIPQRYGFIGAYLGEDKIKTEKMGFPPLIHLRDGYAAMLLRFNAKRNEVEQMISQFKFGNFKSDWESKTADEALGNFLKSFGV